MMIQQYLKQYLLTLSLCPIIIILVTLYLSSMNSYLHTSYYNIHKYKYTYTYIKCDAKKKITPNVEKYLKMRDLIKSQKAGLSYEELKEKAVNGSSVSSSIINDGSSKKSYQSLVGRKGLTLDQRLRSVIAYKRESISNGDDGSGLTVAEEIELENMMESDDDDNDNSDDDDDDNDEYDEELLYETLILKAIENNKLNEVKKNILMSQAISAAKEGKLEEGNNPLISSSGDDAELDALLEDEVVDGNSSSSGGILSSSSSSSSSSKSSSLTTSTTTTTITTTISTATSNSTSNSTSSLATDDLYTPKVATWGLFSRPKDISKAYGGERVTMIIIIIIIINNSIIIINNTIIIIIIPSS